MLSIGKKIIEARREKTQTWLAKKIGITPKTLSNFETGNTSTLKVSTLCDIAKATNTPLSYFIGDGEDNRSITYQSPISAKLAIKKKESPLRHILDYTTLNPEDILIYPLPLGFNNPRRKSLAQHAIIRKYGQYPPRSGDIAVIEHKDKHFIRLFLEMTIGGKKVYNLRNPDDHNDDIEIFSLEGYKFIGFLVGIKECTIRKFD